MDLDSNQLDQLEMALNSLKGLSRGQSTQFTDPSYIDFGIGKMVKPT